VDYIATCNIVAKVFVQNMSALFDWWYVSLQL
jgi:hypothetical protein